SEKPGVLFIGNFLGPGVGARSLSEDIAEWLRQLGWPVQKTSSQLPKLARLLDMLATIWRRRGTYGIAHVDVFERLAFIWACAAIFLVRSRGKPYVLTLRGGKLPNLAQRRPWVLKRLLRSASAVTVPSGYYLQLMRSFRADIRVVPNSIDLARYDFQL